MKNIILSAPEFISLLPPNLIGLTIVCMVCACAVFGAALWLVKASGAIIIVEEEKEE